MFASFLKLTLRNLLRQKFSSFINIFGLALGFASFILIGLYVHDELQYDQFHEKKERIYRLYSNTFHVDRTMAHLPARLYIPLSENLPEAEAVARVFSWSGPASIEIDNKTYEEPGLYFVDPAFLELFSYSIKTGSLENFTQKPNSVLINPEVAHRLFGDEDPVGRMLRVFDHFDLEVAGVLEDYSTRSHFQFTMLANLETMESVNTFMFEDWGNYSSLYYLLLRQDADPQAVGSKIRDLMFAARGMEDKQQQLHFGLQPLQEVYLGSASIETPFEMEAGSHSSVIIFSASALFILLLAGFNYVNLATAKSTSRAREVGIRKLLGAERKQLIRYFLVESFLVCLISMIVGIGLAEMLSPVFSNIAGKHITYSMIDLRYLPVLFIGLTLVVSFTAGIYPAFVVSRFRPVNVLKGSASLFSGHVKGKLGVNLRLRQLLIILQFAISIGLVTASLVLYRQTSHVIANNGFEKDSLLVVRNNTSDRMMSTYQGFKARMLQYPFVTSISAGGHVPTNEPGNQGGLRQPSQSNDERQLVYFATVDFDYFETLGASLLEGRTFDNTFGTDSTQAVVLNQSAARVLGLQQAEGTEITGFWDGHNKKVIGVVDDIHFGSAHLKVQPTAFFVGYEFNYYAPATYYIVIRFNNTNISEVVNAMQQSWQDHAPQDAPLNYFFMDAAYEAMYFKERQLIRVAGIFTILAIIIACMGLLGTTAFVMEARRKEFGVRKVLGASSWQLAGMISREFTLLIVVSNLIAWPLTWYLMSRWLENFVYRIELSVWIFAGAGTVGLLLTLITVNSLAWRQARRNPVHALKYE